MTTSALPVRVAALVASAALTAGGVLAGAAPACAAPSRCGNAALTVTRTYIDSGAGHSWMSLIYRNTGGRTCTVHGYPGLDAVSGSGHVLAHARRTASGYGSGGAVRSITVRPGGYASAGVEWLNFDGRTGGACRTAAAIRTIVANTTRVHRLAVSPTACGLQVHPTVAGTPGYPHYAPAQRYWIAGSRVDAARLNFYLSRSAANLRAATVYATPLAELEQLISYPPTGLTPGQVARARADVRDLDAFFGTPRLYS